MTSEPVEEAEAATAEAAAAEAPERSPTEAGPPTAADGPPAEEAVAVEEPATVIEAARELSSLGREILSPVGTILEDQATRVEKVRALVRNVDSGWLRLALATDALAALVVGGVVLVSGVTDALMFLLMEFLVAVALLRYVRASVDGLRWRRLLRAVSCAALQCLWAWLLLGRIGSEPLWAESLPVQREPLPILWLPVWAHVVVAALVLVHVPLKRFLPATSFEA